MGAWVETTYTQRFLFDMVVAPYVGAWVETICFVIISHVINVAPYVGAWVETEQQMPEKQSLEVAPYVGAWVETIVLMHVYFHFLSHLTWVRGLKLIFPMILLCRLLSRTLRGCVG